MNFIKNAFKKNFIAGTLVLLPIIITVWILKELVVWADSFAISMLPAKMHPYAILGKDVPGLGIIVTIILVLFVGLLTRLYIGKKIVSLGDKIFARIPIGRSVYALIKEFLTAILGSNNEKFKSVVLVEWPRKGSYMLAFVTGYPKPFVGDQIGKWVSLFVPTTPNPTSGFFIMLPESEVKAIPMSIDTAFKIIVSGGVAGINESYCTK